MKYPLTAILWPLLLITVNSYAATYYLSSSTGNDSRTVLQAQKPSTPWKSLGKINAITLAPGDVVYLKRGDVFTGSLMVGQSGTGGQAITFSAYGTGANPRISGFTTLSSWTNEGRGVYSASLTTPALNMVTLDGVVRTMGRYPKAGTVLTYESHNGNTSITDTELTDVQNWVGAEVVIRKHRWILDRHIVTAHNGGTLAYANTSHGSNASPIDGAGYFIQNHLATLRAYGDWYYDTTSHKLYMYFGAELPARHVVKVSCTDKLVTLNSRNYISFKQIDIEGSNTHSVYMESSNNISFDSCNLLYNGGFGILGNGPCNNVTWTSGSIRYTCVGAINLTYRCNNLTVNGAQITDVGNYVGLGYGGEGVQIGIYCGGDGTTVKNCKIKNAGYNGIHFVGSNVLVENNLVDTFNLTQDDGGGIYTYTGLSRPPCTNRVIRNNIVLNGLGASKANGTDRASHGIYIDDQSANTVVTGNSVYNCATSGIFFHAVASGNSMVNNTVFACGRQGYIENLSRDEAQQTSNLSMTGNKFISRDMESPTLVVSASTDARLKDQFNMVTDNYYVRPYHNVASIHTSGSEGSYGLNRSIQGWKDYLGKDANAATSARTFVPYTYITIGPNKATGFIGSQYFHTGPTTLDHYYVLTFTTRGTQINKDVRVHLNSEYYRPNPFDNWKRSTTVQSTTSDTSHTILFQAYGHANDAVTFQKDDPTVTISNIQFHEATVTFANPSENMRFEYNATTSPVTVSLGNYNWLDIANNHYAGAITLQPYTSAVLLRSSPLPSKPIPNRGNTI